MELNREQTKPRIEPYHPVSVVIPPECLDEDGGPCEHDKKEIRKKQNII